MTHQLTIEPLGASIDVEDGQTILDACLRAGIYLPYACGHGLCGTCKVEVLEGDVDHADASPFALMDFERADGKTLACSAKMLCDVTIEADHEIVDFEAIGFMTSEDGVGSSTAGVAVTEGIGEPGEHALHAEHRHVFKIWVL